MDIEKDYEGKIVLATGGAGCIGTNKLFFYKVLKPLLKKEN
jgi:FlaA1/EpsC-like NDP-sugar epimerase